MRLTGGNAFDPRFKKPPRAVLVFDVDDGRVLFRREPERVLPMASLTKIMTALAVVEETRPGERVRVTAAALKYQGSGVGVLPKGKRVPLEALLNGLMLVSGNDAAIALADHVSGSERQFVRLMNEKARLWGLRCTHFASSHGLEKGNRSCAADLAVMTRLAMRNPRITGIVRRREASFRFPIKGGKLYLYGHNPLIRAGYRGAIGLKTGYTDEAGPLLRRRRPPRRPHPGRGAAALVEPAQARYRAAGPRVQLPRARASRRGSGASRARTGDLLLAKQALFQLEPWPRATHIGSTRARWTFVGRRGPPVTPRSARVESPRYDGTEGSVE